MSSIKEYGGPAVATFFSNSFTKLNIESKNIFKIIRNTRWHSESPSSVIPKILRCLDAIMNHSTPTNLTCETIHALFISIEHQVLRAPIVSKAFSMHHWKKSNSITSVGFVENCVGPTYFDSRSALRDGCEHRSRCETAHHPSESCFSFLRWVSMCRCGKRHPVPSRKYSI